MFKRCLALVVMVGLSLHGASLEHASLSQQNTHALSEVADAQSESHNLAKRAHCRCCRKRPPQCIMSQEQFDTMSDTEFRAWQQSQRRKLLMICGIMALVGTILLVELS